MEDVSGGFSMSDRGTVAARESSPVLRNHEPQAALPMSRA